MSDVHIGIVDVHNDRRGTLRLVYHIPVTARKAGVAPTPTSVLGDKVSSQESAKLAAGELIEVPAEITIDKGMSKADIIAAIKRNYAAVAAERNRDYGLQYLFQGEAFDV